MDYSPPSSSIHGILRARILEWVAISFSRDLPDPGNEPRSPTLQADAFNLCTTREALVGVKCYYLCFQNDSCSPLVGLGILFQITWRRKWQSTLVFLPGESHGRRSLVGYSPWVAKSRTRLSDFTFTFFSSWRTSFRISVNASQEMKNSFRFSLLSLPHFWRTAWPGTVTLKIFISIVWMSSQSLMACKISSEKSTCCLVGGFLYVMSCFSFDFLQNSFFVFNFWQFIYNVSSCFCCCYSFATYFLTLLRLHGL